jgi:uncharacterized protein YcfJ
MTTTLSLFRTPVAGMFAAALVALAGPAAAHVVNPHTRHVVQTACGNCGTVESVSQVRHAGRANGIAGTQVTPGMAIGGVVGGLLGNQIGHGNGRAVATVAGVAGGAYAGNAIERSQRSYLAYVMRIRMNDGTSRTVEQRTALARGAHVVVEGNTAHLQNARRG